MLPRTDRIFIEGFTSGLTCSGIGCDYKAGTEGYNLWWGAFNQAKDLNIRDVVIKILLKYKIT